jgi:thymidylate synthase (FAD)
MKNKVELLDVFGDDLMIVNAARVSFGKNKKVLDEKDEKLINYLVEHKHTAPFRHPQLQFRITCPIYVERQLFKHQVGMSANSISGRYVDFSDSYTTITEWRKQSKSSKQGSEGILDLAEQNLANKFQEDVINYCKYRYDQLIELGVSKEQARTILPLNLNTTFIWTGSLLAFKHLFNLRLKPDTQQETRDIANQMLQCIKDIEGNPFKWTIKAFGYEH